MTAPIFRSVEQLTGQIAQVECERDEWCNRCGALIAENERLTTELNALHAKLGEANSQRDTAKAQVAHYRTYYTRTGW